jgi:hypothetical protein
MAKQVIAFELTTDSKQAEASVGNFKKQLREATAELVNMSMQFGEASAEAINAAKKVAGLKDAIGDAKALAETFNPDKKFVALGGALQGATAGFSALQGAIGLFGDENKDLEKTLLKVQSAMALQQGISGVAGAMDSFKLLGNEIKGNLVKAFSTLKGAIISTGIGLLVVSVGLLIANFDKVKEVMLNLIPGLGKVADFFGNMIEKITDFVGVTSEAERELQKLNDATEARNSTIDQQMKVLGALGNQEAEIHKLRQERAANEVDLLLAKTKRTKEEDAKLIELNTQRTVNEIENTKRIQKANEDAAKKAKELRDKNAKQRKEDEEKRIKLSREGEEAARKQMEIDLDNAGKQIKEQEELNEREAFFARTKVTINHNAANAIKEQVKLTELQKSDILRNSLDEDLKNAEILKNAKIKATTDTLNIVSDILGKESAAGKAVAIASALINTYLGISAGVKLGYPAAIPAVLAAAATGFKAVKNIMSTKVPGAASSSGGGGGGSMSAPSLSSSTAPITPQAQTTTLSTQSINQIGVASSRAYVLESDVSGNQERTQRLNRAARIN